MEVRSETENPKLEAGFTDGPASTPHQGGAERSKQVYRGTARLVSILCTCGHDAGFQERSKATRKPVRKIVCTHHHADHTLGLTWFDKDIPVIAHRYMRERMIETGLDLAHYRGVNPEYAGELKRLKPRFPDVTYEGSMTLRLGKRVVELHHLGHAHSKGDTVVYLPEERVLFTGNLFTTTPAPFDAHIADTMRTIIKPWSIPCSGARRLA